MATAAKHPHHDPRQNRILAALPGHDFERLSEALEFLVLPLGWTMSESGDHVNYLHFPTTGIVSLIYELEDGSSSEIALVGNEGMVGISIFMGGESMPSSTVINRAGLEEQVCECYATVKGEYDRLLPHPSGVK